MRNVARSGKRDGKNTVLFIHVIVVGLIVVSYCTTMVELASTASEEGGQNESQLVEGSDFFFVPWTARVDLKIQDGWRLRQGLEDRTKVGGFKNLARVFVPICIWLFT